MLIRKIKDSELEKSREICYTAFEFNIDGEENPVKSANMIRHTPQTRMKQHYLNTYGAFHDNGEMQACISHCIAAINFDGSIATVAEVGDVACLPCCRGTGAIKKMFSTMLHDTYNNKIQFSYLYPFSGTYYQQFGYSYCVQNLVWKVSLDQLPTFSTCGIIVQFSKDRLTDLTKIYHRFTANRNLSIVREEIEWHYAVGRFDTFRDHVFTYIYYDENQQPLGYLTYNKQPDEHGMTMMNCTAFCFSNHKGLLGLLEFLKSKKADSVFAQITLPNDIDLTYIIPEHNMGAQRTTTAQSKTHGMVRIIHLQEALKVAKPLNSGRVRVKITDNYLSQNDGIWDLQWENGTFTSICKNDTNLGENIDMILDIGLFSRLLCSGISANQLFLLPDNTYTCKPSVLCNLFPVKSVGIFEYF